MPLRGTKTNLRTTKSNIPKTKTQKLRWARAESLVARRQGAKSEKDVPWGLVNKIYQNQEKANKTLTMKDLESAAKTYKKKGAYDKGKSKYLTDKKKK